MILIDAQAFKYYVYDKWNKNEITNEEAIQFREWLKDQEAVIETNDDITRVVVKGVEYMPVIRCKDCKYNPQNPRSYYDNDEVYTYLMCGHLNGGEGGFCSNYKPAERKEK